MKSNFPRALDQSKPTQISLDQGHNVEDNVVLKKDGDGDVVLHRDPEIAVKNVYDHRPPLLVEESGELTTLGKVARQFDKNPSNPEADVDDSLLTRLSKRVQRYARGESQVRVAGNYIAIDAEGHPLRVLDGNQFIDPVFT